MSTGRCNVLEGEHDATVVRDSPAIGGVGWRGVHGTLGNGAWISRNVSANGRPHTHARIRMKLVHVGHWGKRDAVQVRLDGNLQWAHFHESSTDCPPGWKHHAAFCYSMVGTPVTWEAARDVCRLQGGNTTLLSLFDAGEAVAASSLLLASGLQAAWTGLNDIDVEGLVEWGAGESATFVPWASDNAVGLAAETRDCGMMRADGTIVSVACSERHTAVCKRPVPHSQCSGGDGLPVSVMDVIVPHTAASVVVRVDVLLAGGRSGSVRVVGFDASFKALGSPVTWQLPFPLATHSVELGPGAARGVTALLAVPGLTPTTPYCIAVRIPVWVSQCRAGRVSLCTWCVLCCPTVLRRLLVSRRSAKAPSATQPRWSQPLQRNRPLQEG